MAGAGALTSRSARALIDLGRLRRNYQAVAAAAGRPVMAVVKADAYGHGAAEVARCLEAEGAPLFAVAYVEEGVALRRAGIGAPIVILTPFEDEQAGLLVQERLTPVISTPASLEAVLALGAPLRVHLKVDTGMSRLGFAPDELPAAARALQAHPGLEVDGLMTHLASPDEDPGVTDQQLDRFDALCADLRRQGLQPRYVHAATSAGMLHMRPSHTLVRPGLLLYGLHTRPRSLPVEVQPVMSVSVRIAQIRELPKGAPVSYGGRFVTQRPSRIATLPIGYADGVPRTDGMRERGRFVVRGRSVPVAGTVCMDLTMLDVTDHPDVQVGDEAVLFGDAPSAWDVAACAGTNAWEALTAISARVPRVYVG